MKSTLFQIFLEFEVRPEFHRLLLGFLSCDDQTDLLLFGQLAFLLYNQLPACVRLTLDLDGAKQCGENQSDQFCKESVYDVHIVTKKAPEGAFLFESVLES